jgi:hypothetical protein
MRILLVSCLLFVCLAGCGNEKSSLYHQNEDQAGTSFVNNKGGPVENEVNDRDEMDTYQNPNFLDLSSRESKMGTDVSKAKDVVEMYTDYQPGPVWINGQEMKVTVYTKKGEQPTKEKVAAVQKRLTAALPTYFIDVKMEERE